MEIRKEQDMTGIIGAMEEEVQLLKDAASAVETETIAEMDFCRGQLDGRDVMIVKCGIGKVNAGICTQLLSSRFHAERIINTGVAGSLSRALHIGDLVISTDAVQHDFDVSPIGFAKGEIPYSGLAAFPADPELRRIALRTASRLAPEITVLEGRVCSGDQFVASSAQKESIVSSFGGLCCEMEGAAIAQVCTLNHIPFVILRAISDLADDSAVSFAEFSEAAAHRCAAIVRAMIAELPADAS